MPTEALLRMGIGLVLVVLAILACAWLARRAGLGGTATRRLLREVDGLRLGPRHRISVVEIDNTWLVVGVSASQITLLHTQPAGASVDTVAVAGEDGTLNARAAGFAALLARARGRTQD